MKTRLVIMGGNAFAQSDITVIRIDDQVYLQSATNYQSVLERFYEQVLLPPSAPGKSDHGDIDFLVSQPRFREDEENVEEKVGKEIGAAAVYRNSAMTSYAVPHPQQVDQCIQLDTQLCDPAYLSWLYFITSYGDLVPILGSIHHKLGLIINDKGFWVQLDLPKNANACGIPRNELVVFLTLDPERMMEFLGLNAKRYRAGFKEEEEIFTWIKDGRYFRPVKRPQANPTTTEANGGLAAEGDGQTAPKRRMLARFATYSSTQPPGADSTTPSAQVALEAVTFFDKRKEYDTRLQHCLSEVQDFNFWQQVRAALSGSSSRKARIIRSLKKWVEVENGQLRIGDVAVERSTVSVGTDDEQAERLKWIGEHWEEVYAKEKEQASEGTS